MTDLITRAQAAIVVEELRPLGTELGRRVLVEALLHTTNQQPDPQAFERMLARLRPAVHDPLVLEIMSPSEIPDAYQRPFARNRKLDPERRLRLTARTTQVFGRLLDGLSEGYGGTAKRLTWWIVTSGRILWSLVEIAVPRSFWEAVSEYWLNLLYLIEAVLVLGGIVIGNEKARDLGLVLFAVTAATDLGRRLIGGYLRKRQTTAFFVALGVAVAVGLLVLGVRSAALFVPPRVDAVAG